MKTLFNCLKKKPSLNINKFFNSNLFYNCCKLHEHFIYLKKEHDKINIFLRKISKKISIFFFQMNNNKKEFPAVITQDPLNVFRFENEWNVGLFDCCEDCKLSNFFFNLFNILINYISFVYIFLLAIHFLFIDE